MACGSITHTSILLDKGGGTVATLVGFLLTLAHRYGAVLTVACVNLYTLLVCCDVHLDTSGAGTTSKTAGIIDISELPAGRSSVKALSTPVQPVPQTPSATSTAAPTVFGVVKVECWLSRDWCYRAVRDQDTVCLDISLGVRHPDSGVVQRCVCSERVQVPVYMRGEHDWRGLIKRT